MDDTPTFGMGSWANYFQTALTISADQTPNAPNMLETVPINAIQSMQPVSADQAQSWSGFWQDLTKGVVSYAVAKDARQSGLTNAQAGASAAAQRRPAPAQQVPPGLLLLIVGGIVFAATRGS